MKKGLVLYFVLVASFAGAQSLPDSVLAGLYNNTIKDISRYRKCQDSIVIATRFMNAHLLKGTGECPCHYSDACVNGNDFINFLDTPFIKKQGRWFYSIDHLVYWDTVDIVLRAYETKVTETDLTWVQSRHIQPATVYFIPTARYVYNKVTKNWDAISYDDILKRNSDTTRVWPSWMFPQ